MYGITNLLVVQSGVCTVTKSYAQGCVCVCACVCACVCVSRHMRARCRFKQTSEVSWLCPEPKFCWNRRAISSSSVVVASSECKLEFGAKQIIDFYFVCRCTEHFLRKEVNSRQVLMVDSSRLRLPEGLWQRNEKGLCGEAKTYGTNNYLTVQKHV